MVGENRLIETMSNLDDQVAKGIITQEQGWYETGRAIARYGNHNAIVGTLVGMGIMVIDYIALDVFIKPVSKKLITKFKNKKNSKLKVKKKE